MSQKLQKNPANPAVSNVLWQACLKLSLILFLWLNRI